MGSPGVRRLPRSTEAGRDRVTGTQPAACRVASCVCARVCVCVCVGGVECAETARCRKSERVLRE